MSQNAVTNELAKSPPGTAQATAARRDRRTRRARVAVLVGVLGFLMSQGVLRVFIDHVRPQWRDPTFEVKAAALHQRMNKDPAPFTILFLGSSETAFGVHGRQISDALSRRLGRPVNAFNFGFYGSGPFTYLVFFKRLIERGIRPDLLVIETAPRAVYAPPGAAGYYTPPVASVSLQEIGLIKRYGGVGMEAYRGEWWRSMMAPTYSHRQPILCLEMPFLLPYVGRVETWDAMDEAGWVRFPEMERTEADKQRTISLMSKHHAEQVGQVGDGRPFAAPLLELIALGRQEKIPLAFLVMPEGPNFRSLYKVGGLERFRRDLAATARAFDCEIIDLLELCAEDEFHDSFHLLEPGAVKLSHAVADRLTQRGLLATRPKDASQASRHR